MSAPAAMAWRNSSRFSTSTSTDTPAADARAPATAKAIEAGRHDVVFLDEDGVEQSQPMILAAAHPDGILLRRSEPGYGFAGVEHAARGVLDEHCVPMRRRRGGR